MRKFSLISFGLMLPWIAAGAQDYCTVSGNSTEQWGHYTSEIAISGNQGTTYDLDGLQTAVKQALYFDKTETVLTLLPGETYSVTYTHGSPQWMHTYIYIDFNNDGVFTPELDANEMLTANSELVAFGNYTSTPDNSPNWHASDGTTYESGQKSLGIGNEAPLPFTLPASLAPGDYRVRFLVAYNSIDPCGYSQLAANGGMMADYTIRIENHDPRNVSVKSSDEALGTVAIVSPETTGNTVNTDQAVTVKATATDADAYFVNWTNAVGDVVSTDAEYIYNGGEAVLTANFRQHYLLTITDADNGTTVKAGTTVVESGEYVDKGTELTLRCSVIGKVLKSLLVNEVEKVEEYTANGYTFTMTEATSIEVEFALPVYEVGQLIVEGEGTLVVAEGVSAEGAPTGATFAEGSELEQDSEPVVIATPAANYKIESMIVDGLAVVTDGEALDNEYVSTYADGLIVVYQAYIEGSLKASAKFVKSNNSAIESIGADETGEAEFFNLQGIRVSRENMTPGIYIMRNAEGARKVSVK